MYVSNHHICHRLSEAEAPVGELSNIATHSVFTKDMPLHIVLHMHKQRTLIRLGLQVSMPDAAVGHLGLSCTKIHKGGRQQHECCGKVSRNRNISAIWILCALWWSHDKSPSCTTNITGARGTWTTDHVS